MKVANINEIHNTEEIDNCFEAFSELRPHLKDRESFTSQVQVQQKEGYTLAAIFDEGKAAACVGFRVMTTLAWGKILYIDDLITRGIYRGKGYGGKLLDYAIEQAKSLGCDQVHLDTGFARHAAHRVYVSRGFHFNCHHLALELRCL
jgi:GNAT superfamily N-acetyltransferase